MTLPIGIHPGIAESAYHADPAETPSASASILRTIYDRSPLHAWTAHPRLNPDFEPSTSSEAQAAGTILHSMILGTPAPFRELPYENYRTKEAQTARDAATASGILPILSHKLAELHPVARALRATLERDHPHIWEALTHPDTQREVTAIWRENGTLCRCRFDALAAPAWGLAMDLKFTGVSAEPEKWSRTLREDYLISAALYPRAIRALRGHGIAYRFVVCETEAPYGVSVHSIGPDLEEIGARRLDKALGIWRDCLASGQWPSYAPLVHYATAPSWFLAQDEERATREKIAENLMGGRHAV